MIKIIFLINFIDIVKRKAYRQSYGQCYNFNESIKTKMKKHDQCLKKKNNENYFNDKNKLINNRISIV